MQIWVDADACPYEIKEMLYRAAERGQVQVTLVANQVLRTPPSPWVNSVLVPGGMNIADRRIVELAAPGDLVITADIPLAADIVAKGAEALDPRGELYTTANVGERHAMRNMIDEMRGAGHVMRGPSGFTARNRQAFANQLDRWLARVKKESQVKRSGLVPEVRGTQGHTGAFSRGQRGTIQGASVWSNRSTFSSSIKALESAVNFRVDNEAVVLMEKCSCAVKSRSHRSARSSR